MTVLACLLLWVIWFSHVRTARIYLRLGAGTAVATMVVAGVYALRNYPARPFVTMRGMASTHAVLHGLGFAPLSSLAFIIEFHTREPEGGEVHGSKESR